MTRAIPLFVVGAPRSGTTLTRALLKGFQQVYLPPDEFQILPRFAKIAEQGGNKDALIDLIDRSAFSDHMRRRGLWLDAEALYTIQRNRGAAEGFRSLVLAIAERDGASSLRYWGDKTPETVFHLDLVMRLWPDARVLEITRDPRDTVLSMHRAWGRSLVRGATIWRDAQISTRRFAETYSRDQLLTLTFEALTANPVAEMDRVGAWLGLDYDYRTLDTAASEERWGRASGQTGIQARKSDWENSLSPNQIRQIEEICFDPMQAVGYFPTMAVKSRTPGILALKFAQAGDASRVLCAYARERGWKAAVSYKLGQWRNR